MERLPLFVMECWFEGSIVLVVDLVVVVCVSRGYLKGSLKEYGMDR